VSRIYWDTMLFIYLLEDNKEFGGRVNTILSRMRDREDVLLTSTLAAGELLAGVAKMEAVRRQVELMLEAPFMEVIAFDLSAARHFAEIRSRNKVNAPDAIHLACAARANADLFLTNDRSLAKQTIPGIQFIAGLDVDLF